MKNPSMNCLLNLFALPLILTSALINSKADASTLLDSIPHVTYNIIYQPGSTMKIATERPFMLDKAPVRAELDLPEMNAYIFHATEDGLDHFVSFSKIPHEGCIGRTSVQWNSGQYGNGAVFKFEFDGTVPGFSACSKVGTTAIYVGELR